MLNKKIMHSDKLGFIFPSELKRPNQRAIEEYIIIILLYFFA